MDFLALVIVFLTCYLITYFFIILQEFWKKVRYRLDIFRYNRKFTIDNLKIYFEHIKITPPIKKSLKIDCEGKQNWIFKLKDICKKLQVFFSYAKELGSTSIKVLGVMSRRIKSIRISINGLFIQSATVRF